ncbi:MAG: DUF4349 domain-containing protein [Clostridiales bacterium]|nr:DUF4349 domain-containing protein [Clostridiales bacterium]
MKKKTASDALDRALTALYQTDVPEAYKASWRDAVKREEPSDMKSTPRLAWLRRAALPIAAAAVLIIGTAVTGVIAPKTPEPGPAADYEIQTASAYKASGAGDVNNFDFADGNAVFATPAMASAPRGYAETEDEAAYDMEEAADADTRKIVRTVSLTIASTIFERDYETILSLAEAADGYASSVSMYSQQIDKRYASFELRIPEENLDSFLSSLDGIGRTTDRYETATDKTTQYADTQLRLQTQLDKMTRLQELLLKAESVEDLLDIESEIADTQYEIDSLQSSLNYIDRQVDYATVSVYLQEQTPSDTAAAEDITIGERLVNGLKASLEWLGGFFENMLVFLIAAAPVLIPLIIAYIVYRIVRKRRKAKKQS